MLRGDLQELRESKENELREVNVLHQQDLEKLRQITDERDALRQQHEEAMTASQQEIQLRQRQHDDELQRKDQEIEALKNKEALHSQEILENAAQCAIKDEKLQSNIVQLQAKDEQIDHFNAEIARNQVLQSQQKNLIDAQQEEIKRLSAELARARNSHDVHVLLQPKKTPSTCHVDSIKPNVSSRSVKQLSHSSKDKEINLQVDKASLNIDDGCEMKMNSLLNTSGKRCW